MRQKPMTGRRRAVFVCCDGLGRKWVTRDRTPFLHGIAGHSLWCADHRAVFPSVTRVSAAGRHGMPSGPPRTPRQSHGADRSGEVVVRDVGKPDFRSHMRHATGATLAVPPCRTRRRGRQVIAFRMSRPALAISSIRNISAMSIIAPGRSPRAAPDGAGCARCQPRPRRRNGDDQRFCTEILRRASPAIAGGSPRSHLHGAPLGSPALSRPSADRTMRRGSRRNRDRSLRDEGDDILLHGRLGPRSGDHRR